MYFLTQFHLRSRQEYLSNYLATISPNVTSLSLFYAPGYVQYQNNLPQKAQEILANQLPVDAQELQLYVDKIETQGVDELCRIFKALPKSINSLDLSYFINMIIDKISNDDLVRLVQAVPEHITTFPLSESLTDISTPEKKERFTRFMQNLPSGVIHFPLTINLGRKPLEYYQEIIKTLPTTRQITLNLSNNFLAKKTGPELKEMMRLLPENVIGLNVSRNNLGQMSFNDFMVFIQALPAQLQTLNLGYNYLEQYSVEQWEQIVKALPKGLTSFSIYATQFGSGERFAALLPHLPETVTEVDLSNCGLNITEIGNTLNDGFELKLILKAMPQQVRSLNLDRNYMLNTQVKDIYDALRQTNLVTLSLNSNNIVPEVLKEIQSILDANKSKLEGKKTDVVMSVNDTAQEPEKTVIPQETQAYVETPKQVQAEVKTKKHNTSADANILLRSINFDAHLNAIWGKYEQHYKNNFYARFAAENLYKALFQARKTFLNSDEPISKKKMVFKQECLDAIRASRSVLEEHRGWKQIIANISSAIASIVLLGIPNALTGRGFLGLFPAQTDSAKKINELQSSVNTIKNVFG